MAAEKKTEKALNANTGTERRPVVEFAIENAQALKKRALRQTRVHEGVAAKVGPGEGSEAGSEAKAPAPGSRKQQRKRRREELEVLCLCALTPPYLPQRTFEPGKHLRAGRG